MNNSLSEPAKLLLLCALLAKDRIITDNGKAYLKELVLRRDPRLFQILSKFESRSSADSSFLEQIHNLIEEESRILYDELFEDTSLEVGKTLSKSQREELDLNDEKSLIYGEVDYPSFYRILRKINAPKGSIFYDLGSGTGKAVFAARLTQDFKRCIGIEILSRLHMRAELIVNRFTNKYNTYLCYGGHHDVQVLNDSLIDYDWSDGDVVFANSTCFDDSLMQELSEKAELLKAGSIVITFTKGLTSRPRTFELLERKRYKMSWGPATVFIHRRLNDDGKPVGPPNLNTLPSDRIEYDAEDYYTMPDENDAEEEEDNDDDDDDDVSDDDDAGDNDGNLLTVNSEFRRMTSPQDSALLQRKRRNEML